MEYINKILRKHTKNTWHSMNVHEFRQTNTHTRQRKIKMKIMKKCKENIKQRDTKKDLDYD